MSSTVIIIIIAIALIFWLLFIYNRLIALIEAIKNNFRQIDIQLDRRFKVFESLINVVKKYMDYEQTTLKDVVALRSQAQTATQAGDTAGKIAAENKISKIAGGLNVMFEQYPDLKANQNCLQLQEEIVSTENKLAFAKQAYNDSIETYNATKKSIPQNMVVALFRSALDQSFSYWQLSEEVAKSHENYTVKL
jgi:LemA protein